MGKDKVSKKQAKTKPKAKTKPLDEPAQATTKQPEVPVQEVSPGLFVYVRAALQMFTAWISRNKLKSLGLFLIGLVVLGGLFMLLRPGNELLTNDQIVTKINQELSISGDGNPAVLTVVDDDKVEQPFLDKAENGDKVVLYYKAKKAVLYRPNEERIVHHGTYTPPEAKVFIRSGTRDAAALSEVEKRLESVDGIKIASQDNSPKSDYKGITIVSVTDRYDDKIRQLADMFNTEIVRLPAGESFPDADILIIVGD